MTRHWLVLAGLLLACDSDSTDPVRDGSAGNLPDAGGHDASTDGGATSDASADSAVRDSASDDGSQLDECSVFNESECSQESNCEIVRARPVSDERTLGDLVFIACVDGEECADGDAETCAAAPPGSDGGAIDIPYLFPTLCVPPGWSLRTREVCVADDEDAGL
jgi:hypothetical protein